MTQILPSLRIRVENSIPFVLLLPNRPQTVFPVDKLRCRNQEDWILRWNNGSHSTFPA
jgi:hypothetical protein